LQVWKGGYIDNFLIREPPHEIISLDAEMPPRELGGGKVGKGVGHEANGVFSRGPGYPVVSAAPENNLSVRQLVPPRLHKLG
jgi:hypothetical protein